MLYNRDSYSAPSRFQCKAIAMFCSDSVEQMCLCLFVEYTYLCTMPYVLHLTCHFILDRFESKQVLECSSDNIRIAGLQLNKILSIYCDNVQFRANLSHAVSLPLSVCISLLLSLLSHTPAPLLSPPPPPPLPPSFPYPPYPCIFLVHFPPSAPPSPSLSYFPRWPLCCFLVLLVQIVTCLCISVFTN